MSTIKETNNRQNTHAMSNYFSLISGMLIIPHFLALHFFGISFFTTTLLFYYLIYIILNIFIKRISHKTWQKIVRFNLLLLLVLCLAIEILCTNIFTFLNNYMENERGVYFSEYMRKPQIELLHFLGKKDARIAWQDGYNPLTERSYRTSEFNYHFMTNGEGLRGKLPEMKKAKGEYRISVLGDSYIEGFGTPNDSTFPVLLDSILSPATAVSVINGGICGSSPLYEIELYNKKIKKYNPDLVLLEINLTDILDVDYALHQGHMPLKEYFYAVSHIFRVIYAISLGNNIVNEKIPESLKQSRDKAITDIIRALQSFNQSLIKNNQQLVLIYLPWKSEIAPAAEHTDTPTKSLLSALKTSGIALIDLQNEYKKYNFTNTDSTNTYYWKLDGHHTPAGYEMMAKEVSLKLIERQYVRTH